MYVTSRPMNDAEWIPSLSLNLIMDSNTKGFMGNTWTQLNDNKLFIWNNKKDVIFIPCKCYISEVEKEVKDKSEVQRGG